MIIFGISHISPILPSAGIDKLTIYFHPIDIIEYGVYFNKVLCTLYLIINDRSIIEFINCNTIIIFIVTEYK